MSTEDLELRELEKLKAKLVEKICKIRDELEEQGKSNLHNVRVPNLFPTFYNDPTGKNESSDGNKASSRLCEASQSVLGMQFKDVKKNWIYDNIYRYTAHVITKSIQFSLELTVDIKINEYEIQDINCHFVNVNTAYMLEITSWVHKFTHEKNFSNLISAISDYNEQNLIRSKILYTMDSRGYLSLEKCLNGEGGIIIYFRKPGTTVPIFFKFHWFMKFVEKTWRIEHIFAIDPIRADEKLVSANKNLLQSFCKIGLRKKDLEELWAKLCHVIDNC